MAGKHGDGQRQWGEAVHDRLGLGLSGGLVDDACDLLPKVSRNPVDQLDDLRSDGDERANAEGEHEQVVPGRRLDDGEGERTAEDDEGPGQFEDGQADDRELAEGGVGHDEVQT